jgi:hypothetical protein
MFFSILSISFFVKIFFSALCSIFSVDIFKKYLITKAILNNAIDMAIMLFFVK